MADITTDVPPLFTGRWAALPAAVRELDPTTLPEGFKAGGVAAGIKPSGKLDFGLIVSDRVETTSAARFTMSSAPAAPVEVCRNHADLSALRAVIVNSGNANAATGPFGRDNAIYMQGAGAMASGCSETSIGVASTGVIGQQLDTRALSKGAATVVRELREDGVLDFARAIMTTDLFPKLASLEVELSSGKVTLAAQAKGAGMIAPMHGPPHATLLCFIQTDARIEATACDRMLGRSVSRTFDRVTVDAQLSTNDSVFFIANGASGVEISGDDETIFQSALDSLLQGLAVAVVRDGEGARRIGKVTVTGGDGAQCEKVARAIADSPLVKTALHGGDPNWGRIIQAAGMALATGGSVPIDVTIEGVAVARYGIKEDFDLEALSAAVSGTEVEYEVAIPGDGASAEVIFSDLGHDYVTLNAEYTT
jgi:glutamate N-acetyltransferase/amino-acid N-acetyltransferase